jgi:O-antigen ligase
LAVIAVASLTWIGVDKIAVRMAELERDGFGDRVGVWDDAREIVRAYPLSGTGLNTFGTAMLFHQRRNLGEHFEEAHNDYLQLAAEGGWLVGLPALALIVVTALEIRRRCAGHHERTTMRWTRIGAIAGLLTMALQETGEFSLQMPGNAALFCVLAAMALHRQPPPSSVGQLSLVQDSSVNRQHKRG